MRPITSQFSLILTISALMSGTLLLTSSRLEYCGQPESLRLRNSTATAPNAASPTLAPPQQMVVVTVETDKADLEIGWAD